MKRPSKDKPDTRYAMLDRMRFQTMPMSFDDPADISDLQALQAANLLECNFPAAAWVGGELRYAGPAVVVRMTALGRVRAERFSAEMNHVRRAAS